MEMKQVYEALEKVENGADLIAAIKGEINTLNNEAKKHRTAGEQSATKLKSILEAVGLDDGDDVVNKAKGLKTTLDQFAQGGKKYPKNALMCCFAGFRRLDSQNFSRR